MFHVRSIPPPAIPSSKSLTCPRHTAPHTGIGILAEAIVALENNPVPLKISRANPVFSSYQCFAETGNMPKDWEKAIKVGAKSQKGLEKFAKKLAESSLAGRAQVATTRAFDLISVSSKHNQRQGEP